MNTTFHERIMKKENVKKLAFNINRIEKFGINIWDDFLEPGNTYAYVESPQNTYNELDKELLTYMCDIVQQNTDIKCEVVLVDSSEKYPHLIGHEMEHLLTIRYELHFQQVSYEDIDTVVELFEEAEYKTVPLNVYTES